MASLAAQLHSLRLQSYRPYSFPCHRCIRGLMPHHPCHSCASFGRGRGSGRGYQLRSFGRPSGRGRGRGSFLAVRIREVTMGVSMVHSSTATGSVPLILALGVRPFWVWGSVLRGRSHYSTHVNSRAESAAMLHTSSHLFTPLHTSVTSLLHFLHFCTLFTVLYTFFHTSVHFFTLLSTSFHLCTLVYTCVHLCTLVYTSVHFCTLLYTSVHFCTLLYTS